MQGISNCNILYITVLSNILESKMGKKIYQFSSINALVGGVFDGLFSVYDIKQKGNFGLGCTITLKGELIINDSNFFEAAGRQNLRVMKEEEHLPFAQITTFKADRIIEIDHINKTNLYDHLAQHTLLDNIFLAIKIEGVFNTIKIRRPDDTGKVYPSLSDLSAGQLVDNITDISGQLIGFWTPKFFQNISVEGFHFHFIDIEKRIGGHVLDFSIDKARISYEVKNMINIELSENESYLRHDLNIDNIVDIIKKVEN